MAQRSTRSVFETGIKVLDVLVPLERAGKVGLFRNAGVGAELSQLEERIANTERGAITSIHAV